VSSLQSGTTRDGELAATLQEQALAFEKEKDQLVATHKIIKNAYDKKLAGTQKSLLSTKQSLEAATIKTQCLLDHMDALTKEKKQIKVCLAKYRDCVQECVRKNGHAQVNFGNLKKAFTDSRARVSKKW